MHVNPQIFEVMILMKELSFVIEEEDTLKKMQKQLLYKS